MRQRALAILAGLACHGVFAVAVTRMAMSLFLGMTPGRGPFRGAAAWLANSALLLTFPVLHSWLLSDDGRRRLARLTPARLGWPLITTTFALVTSLHLVALFTFWSPSGPVWWRASGPALAVTLAASAGAWVLLMTAMTQARLAVQTGFLGWSAVSLNRRPDYHGFPERGLYAIVRQPIYIAFALIPLCAGVWSADQLFVAGVLGAYCVLGSAQKERRFLRYYGDAFRRYQALVPFWIPRLMKWPSRARPDAGGLPRTPTDVDVIIVGGGPVGLLLALALGLRGRQVLVAERRVGGLQRSMAIGITPPSLAILRQVGLDDAFVRAGIRIARAAVTEDGQPLGDVDFSSLAVDHPYILSLPQSETVRLLRERLAGIASVRVMEGLEFVRLEPAADAVRVWLRDARGGSETVLSARYLAGCDGARSLVREAAGIPLRRRSYRPRFVMADFEDQTGFGDVARLFFSPGGSVEAFPLSGGLRRWIVLANRWDGREGVADYIRCRVLALTGCDLSGAASRFESAFQPQWGLAASYVRDRIVLCGDAAHQMSPIGGQGMNTGFADAAMLAEVLDLGVAGVPGHASRAALYDRIRRRAFRAAAARAARGMWLGTRTGRVASWLRRLFITHVLFHEGVKRRLAPHFAMLTLPPPVPVGRCGANA